MVMGRMGQAGRMRTVGSVVAACTLELAGCTPSHHSPPEAPGSTGAGPSTVQPVRTALPAIIDFVEKQRGLTFKPPVPAKVLGQKAFLRALHRGDEAPSPH